ncbi:MAG: LacI family DNA-binding transcriptional regulator [Bacteroidota bacterium]
MIKSVTLKDIATALGLSASTVSRALRDGYEISHDTKKRVNDYAKKINYNCNLVALSLKNRRSYSIGVVLCEVSNNFFAQTINGIESIAYEKGYNVIISQSHDSYEREVMNVNHLANRSVDGLLISMAAETTDFSHITSLHKKGLPIVFFDRIIDEIQTHKVTSNNFQGSFQATELLIKAGKTRIAHLANAPQLSITKERLSGYKAALEKYNIKFNPDYVKHCHHGGRLQHEVEDVVKAFLQMKNKPDAVFVASDRLSVCFLTAIKNFNIDPKEIGIAGFSNSDVIELMQPSFSYVRQSAFEMGQVATRMLIQLIESKHPVTEFEKRVLDTETFLNNPTVIHEPQIIL